MRSIKFCLLVLFIILSGFVRVYAADDEEDLFKPVEVKDGSSLSVIDCVAVAFKNSPKIKRKKYNLDIVNIPLHFFFTKSFKLLALMRHSIVFA